jgi:hypothetical protein
LALAVSKEHKFVLQKQRVLPTEWIFSLWLLVEPTIISLHGSVVDNGKEKVFCEAAVRFKICSSHSYFSDVGYKYTFLLFLLNYGWHFIC